MATASDPTPSTRHRRLGWKSITAIILLTLALGAAIAYLLFKSEPAHWKEHQALLRTTTVEDRQTLAIGLEQRFLNAFSYSQPPAPGIPAPGSASGNPGVTGNMQLSNVNDPAANRANLQKSVETALTDGLGERQIQATPQEINAWMETRLPQVLANQNIKLPTEIQQPMIALRDRRLILSFRYTAEQTTAVVSMHFEPQMVTDGAGKPKLQMRLNSIQGGRLPMPVSGLTAGLRKQAEEKRSQIVGQVVQAMEGQAFDPTVRSPDGQRLIRLTGFTFSDKQVDLRLNIEPYERQ